MDLLDPEIEGEEEGEARGRKVGATLLAYVFRHREDLAMSRPLIITSQPRRCISRAISFPMPPEEPVTCSFDDVARPFS